MIIIIIIHYMVLIYLMIFLFTITFNGINLKQNFNDK